MTKLSRKQIAEGLEAVPIEAVLLGATNPKGIKLTSKQKRFAEEIARGETKAGAYRKAYNSKGSPRTASRRGQELAKKGAVSAQVDAIRLALERQKYTTPAALRALVIDRLTEKAIDPELPPAQQLRALQLLGTVTEVAAFTARSETRTITDSADIRTKLIESIRTAIKADAIDVETIQSDDLLAEIAKSRKPPADADSTPADPTAPGPPAHDSADSQAVIHTIPLIQSSPQEAHLPNSQGVEMESNSDTQNY